MVKRALLRARRRRGRTVGPRWRRTDAAPASLLPGMLRPPQRYGTDAAFTEPNSPRVHTAPTPKRGMCVCVCVGGGGGLRAGGGEWGG